MHAIAFHLQSLPGHVLPRIGMRPLRGRGRGADRSADYSSGDDLVEHHFTQRSILAHQCYASMREAIHLLGEKPSVILETGAAAWGTNSSLLFDSYVSCFGGEFFTVDIRLPPLIKLRGIVGHRTRLTCDDSVRFLKRWVRANRGRTADLVYLDSLDLDPLSPYEAAVHGIREYFAIRPALGNGSLLLIDDTPISPIACPAEWRQDAESFLEREGVMPGKGMLIVPYLDSARGVTKLHHGYQALYRFDR